MKPKLLSLALTVALVFTAAPGLAVNLGQSAPALTVSDASGPLDMNQFKGKFLYVDFWASWCGPCVKSFPWMNEMQAKYGPQGLVILGVNTDSKREDADKFLARVPAKFRIAFDPRGDAATLYEVQAMPSSFLIGPDGKLLLKHAGYRDEQKAELEQSIASALSKK